MYKTIICILVFVALSRPGSPAETALSLDMNQAIRVGLANHYALRIIQGRKKAIHKLISERWRGFAPNLYLSYNRVLEEAKGLRDIRGHEIRLDIEQVLYDGGKRGLDLDIAKLESVLASNDFKINYNLIRQGIQETFVNALAAKGKIFLYQKSLERGKVQYRLIGEQHKQGFATKLAVLDTIARLQEIKLALSRSRLEYQHSLYELKGILNLDPATELELDGDLYHDFVLSRPKIELLRLLKKAQKFRPEVVRSRIEIRRLRKISKLAKSYWVPKLALNGYVAESGSRFPLRDQDLGVNFTVSLPFGDSPALGSSEISRKNENGKSNNLQSQLNVLGDLSPERKIMEADNLLAEALYSGMQLDNQVAIEVREAYDNLLEAWAAIHFGNVRVFAGYQKLIVMSTKFAVGRAIRSETLEAETDLLRAQEDLTNSIALYIANVIKLESAASLEPGGSHLFSFRKGKGNSLLVEMKDSDFKYPDKGLNEMKNSKKLKNFLLDEEKID